ncbi:MAG: hypothetical protein QHH80_05835 [Anaerolineae bacterium]|nr:hypothetical protein [Anaerolineae bacterium]
MTNERTARHTASVRFGHPPPPIHPPARVDYRDAGAYFVAIVAHGRECVFGHIADRRMVVNECGEIAATCWHDWPRHYQGVEWDALGRSMLCPYDGMHGIHHACDAPDQRCAPIIGRHRAFVQIGRCAAHQ